MNAIRKIKKQMSILTNKQLRDVKLRTEITPKKQRGK